MTALNSFSIARDLHAPIPEMMDVVSSERVLESKGLFIIPYDITRLVAFVKVEIDVISTVNETLSKWTNPEIGFYGYCHIRSYKQSIGNPVQINQRNQVLFQWYPPENLLAATLMNSVFSILQLLEAVITLPNPIYLVSPLITDLSFGFQRDGKFLVTTSIGYFKDGVFPDNSLYQPVQNVPNPEDVENTDPSPFKDLGDPNTPVSPPYRPDNNDFNESSPGDPVTDPLPEGVPFGVVWNASGPGFDFVEARSFEYYGSTPTSINLTPTVVGNQYVIQVTSQDGVTNLFLRNLFVTPEQNESFLSTFEVVGYYYP